MMDGYRPECKYSFPPNSDTVLTLCKDERQHSVTAPYQHSYSGHGHEDHGFGGEYDEAPMEKPLTRLEVFMQRSVFGWPFYTIIIAMGQLLSAVSHLCCACGKMLIGRHRSS
jgi:alpha-1,3-glucan synthase